ncbi:cyanoexosortase B [Romeria aff. gracilis LEGE 07310]|uniref:Cyanoexosortase B n=1 Tax=Vasconcelosia minhoensis LEGE 07310 TaxID=915328 RepID=A0A8J7A7F4_9CYAN|nr:cyanoexosortase B [Romeria gracilis]MBE9077485.1 cyanoexosortase B [Romeria aff. gracilis LEGE 07310]
MVATRQSLKSFQRPPLTALILGLLAVLYGPLLWHWVDGWLTKSISIQHEYFSHGLLGIPFAAYLAWGKRQSWQRLEPRLHWLSLPLLGLAFGLYSSGLSDLMNLSLPLLLTGLCLALKGWPGLRLEAFPLLLLALATPTQLPYLIEPYILPLQQFIAATAGVLLQQFGMDVQVNQIYLAVNGQLVEVAPHCAGLKMLFTSLYMGLILAYWTGLNRSRLRTGLFFIGIVGISIVGNIIRNTLLAFFHGSGQRSAFDWLHESWGGDLYSAAMLGSLIVLIRAIEHAVPPSLNLAAPASSMAEPDRTGGQPPRGYF